MNAPFASRRALALMVAAAALAIAFGAASLARAQTRLDLATHWPDGNFHTTAVKRFADETSKATGGHVQITVLAVGSLGFMAPEQQCAVRDGLVSMADLSTI